MSESEPQVFVGERDVVSVSGEEAASYLQGQLSQDVVGLPVGSSAWSFILQPQGKVDAWFRVNRTADDAYLLDVDAGFGEVLLARLQRFKLRTKADLALETWTLHAYDSEVPVSKHAHIAAPAVDGVGLDVLGPELDEPVGEVMSADEFELRRIRGGVPKMGSELNEATIPAESLVVDASVSFTKGCYTGQELVARVDSRGNNTPRRLRIVSGSGPIPAGSELLSGDSVAGEITSVAVDGDGWIGLAYIKRSFLEETSLNSVHVAMTPAEEALGAEA